MTEKLAAHINKNLPFLKDKKLLIAISGGIDSVVLTHLMHQLNANFSLAHCNFNLRKLASDLDEKFVEELGKKLNVKTFITHFDTEKIAKEKKQSIQVTARNLRYSWFNQLIDTFQFDYLLTAHQLDDSLETFLINLTRGTGLEGLTGIPAVNKKIVRPLLIFSREEIVTFATKNNIVWREDNSNNSNKYLRNKIRHNVIPLLKEINPNLLPSFLKTSEHLQESQFIINQTIQELKANIFIETAGKPIKINISKINALPNPKAYLYALLKPYNFTAWDDIVHLLHAQSGKKIVSETHELLKNRDYLLLSKKQDNCKKEPVFTISKNTTIITEPLSLQLCEVKKSTRSNKLTIYVDKDKITFPLTVRKWQAGDYFYPTGMLGKKKISKFFKDEKYSLLEKEHTWLLCNNNQIIWVIGKRQDRRFLKDQHTNTLIKIVAMHI